MRYILLCLLAPLLLAANRPATSTINARPALWKISDADTTIYLFGTVHILKPGMRWFYGPVQSAFSASDELMLEMVEPSQDETNKLIMKRAVDPDGPPLSAKLSTKDKLRYLAALGSIGMTRDSLEPLEPWFVSTLISLIPLQNLGYSADSGVEKTLTLEARKAGKPVHGLETMDDQIGFFDKLPEPAQIAMLNQSVRDMGRIKPDAEAMMQSWSQGEPDKLAALMNKGLDATPDLSRALLHDRNQRWADWIAHRLDRPGTVFLAVGAAHLAGRQSVQSMLARQKLQAVRVR